MMCFSLKFELSLAPLSENVKKDCSPTHFECVYSLKASDNQKHEDVN